jgi:hypothetical protein
MGIQMNNYNDSLIQEFLKSTSDVDPRTPEEIAQGTIPASDQDRRAEAAWSALQAKKLTDQSVRPTTIRLEKPAWHKTSQGRLRFGSRLAATILIACSLVLFGRFTAWRNWQFFKVHDLVVQKDDGHPDQRLAPGVIRDNFSAEEGKQFDGGELSIANPQFTLLWDSTVDLDLHVIEPGGKDIYSESPVSDVADAGMDVSNSEGYGPENIGFVKNKNKFNSKTKEPKYYRWFVRYVDSPDGRNIRTRWKVRVKYNGNSEVFSGRLDHIGSQSNEMILKIE